MIVKNRIYILISIMFLFQDSLFSQKQPTEKEIKRSDDYYWGQAYNADSNQAKSAARDDLMFKISNQISTSEHLNSKSDLFVNNIKYLFKPVDELIKVIAYVPKKDVNNLLMNKSPLVVNEIKYTEEKDTSNVEDQNKKSTATLEDKQIERKPDVIVNKGEQPYPVGQSLIEQLIACNTKDELQRLLTKEESQNTLIFNWDSKTYRKNTSSENFYIVLIDPNDNKVKAFVDKGKSNRKDLKNNQRIVNIEGESQNFIQVWIQVL